MHGPGGEVRIRLRNSKRAIQHIEGLHSVADIDDLRIRHNIEDDALHRAHKVVVGAKIGSQSNDRTIRQSFLADGRHSTPRGRKNLLVTSESSHCGNAEEGVSGYSDTPI